ncbi:uroporphyrinogen-III C-methyltransferase [Solimonas sp. K1W22B-7]|uniref:siroheme synthase CysG n=1 Tax=Solimonas sp. K1W22B-7 TaxID=2303331 RepID=UPI000E3309A0|nr:siroheme synthase CysG [Solimonas sp. K1W22B-7]AXQ29156.1 uroporphyrinogen-III C-methyltransferase [Solimonas sp. K1W22B-7]
MEHFPIFLRLKEARVLVIGGGEVAARKIRLLRRAGARIEIVARELNAELSGMAAAGELAHGGAEFDPAQVDGCRLVVAATDDLPLNARVAAAAMAANVPVNVVDNPELSTYITPSIVERSPVTVAIGTGGAAPVLARRLRERIETLLPVAYGRLGEFMGRHRPRVKALPTEARRKLWEDFLDGPGPERLFVGDESAAAIELESLLLGEPPRGEVYLVGAGPGDPDLLTFRALRLMQQADVVLYDRLVSPAILDLVRRDAERLFVGKQRNLHTVPQEEINAELVRLAEQGKRVLRLKGGDPFIFGRGGEEIDQIAARGIPFQVVPGITAASGCSAYAGIPLTHRDYAQSCIFVTGHARADGTLNLHWDQLARRGQTVVIYMGLATLPELCRQFIAHGLPPDWPAAIVEDGTSRSQRVLASTLADLPGQVARSDVKGATLVIVGEVVKLRERLKWFQAGR